MRKVIVDEWMSVDGVVQAPGAPDEDTSGGFAHGGWHLPYFDEVSQGRVVEGIASAGGFLLGRRTYEILAAYWPSAPDDQAVIAVPLNTKPKHVASRTLSEPLAWQGSTLLGDDVAASVTALKEQDGGDLHVIGSTQLVQTLVQHDLVDEYRLMIDPLVLGGGKRLFREDGVVRKLRLLESQATSTGAILVTYTRAD